MSITPALSAAAATLATLSCTVRSWPPSWSSCFKYFCAGLKYFLSAGGLRRTCWQAGSVVSCFLLRTMDLILSTSSRMLISTEFRSSRWPPGHNGGSELNRYFNIYYIDIDIDILISMHILCKVSLKCLRCEYFHS